jgi:hypothetical protein
VWLYYHPQFTIKEVTVGKVKIFAVVSRVVSDSTGILTQSIWFQCPNYKEVHSTLFVKMRLNANLND